MFILAQNKKILINSEFVSQFSIATNPGVAWISASYNDDTTNLILATYANKKEGCEVFSDLCEAMSSGVTVYRMPGRKLSDGEKEGKNLSWNDDGSCPVCGKYDNKDPFGSKVCPNCGAKMIQEEDHGN